MKQHLTTLRALYARRVQEELLTIVLEAQRDIYLGVGKERELTETEFDEHITNLGRILNAHLSIRRTDHTIVAVQALIEGSKSPTPSPSHRYTFGEKLHD